MMLPSANDTRLWRDDIQRFALMICRAGADDIHGFAVICCRGAARRGKNLKKQAGCFVIVVFSIDKS